MRQALTVHFGPAGSVSALLRADAVVWTSEQARHWLDGQFLVLECEPVRASGKVLTADKVLAIAGALGLAGLQQDEALRSDFAHAVTAALGRPLVTVDVVAGAVSF